MLDEITKIGVVISGAIYRLEADDDKTKLDRSKERTMSTPQSAATKVVPFPLSPVEQCVRDVLQCLPDDWTPPTPETVSRT